MEALYKSLLKQILENGKLKSNRTDTKALSLFALNLDFNIAKQFPLLTSKFIDFNIIETEFQWFINGQTNTDYFKERGIKIWDAWADKDGNLGPVYGFQMLNFNGKNYNQLKALIKSLKENPNTRRHIISLWNPLQLHEMALPPCYLYFQFYVDNNDLNLFVVQRSGDMFAGVPYDIGLFSYFLIYVANQVNLQPANISLKIVDAHIYENHIDGVKEYLCKTEFDLPTWTFENNKLSINNYKHHSKIKIKIAI